MTQITATQPQFILASGSPRRDELTRQMGLVPIVIKSNIPEERQSHEQPRAYTERLALEKASDVAGKVASRDDRDALPGWILSADTIVVQGDDILEKPRSNAHAVAMLQSLSGHVHHVLTSYCWWHRDTGSHRVETVATEVHFRALLKDEIERYVATGEPMDKAGAYGIQGIGGFLIEKIVGSYTCVVGLPVTEVLLTLRQMGGLGPFPFVGASS